VSLFTQVKTIDMANDPLAIKRVCSFLKEEKDE